jgi:mono/diheme cytochrome c family protein
MSLLNPHRTAHRPRAAAAWMAAIVIIIAPAAGAATPAELLAGYGREAGAAAKPDRGQLLFNSNHGREWSCASCHGRHAAPGLPIAALAPAFNPERFTDAAKADK